MEQTPFELTSEQKGLLATLSRETGKPIPALLAEALEVLQEHESLAHSHGHGTPHGSHEDAAAQPPPEAPLPIWQLFAEAFLDVPEEELARLPTDLAAQVDHYIYGLPKRAE